MARIRGRVFQWVLSIDTLLGQKSLHVALFFLLPVKVMLVNELVHILKHQGLFGGELDVLLEKLLLFCVPISLCGLKKCLSTLRKKI